METFWSHTQQLGEPYSSCSSSKEAFHCGRIAAERQIRDKCKCSYGLLHRMHDEDPGATHLPVCNFTSRIRCVNRFVIDYISDDHTLGTVSYSHYGRQWCWWHRYDGDNFRMLVTEKRVGDIFLHVDTIGWHPRPNFTLTQSVSKLFIIVLYWRHIVGDRFPPSFYY